MATPEPPKALSPEEELVLQIEGSSDNGEFVTTTLKTDERVIARVTDGIYRQPSSAIRELINNAYDADATRVVIKTDAPRFEKITVEDNGIGMSPKTIAHMLMHIGGSAKRNAIGQSLGLANESNPTNSPSGRKLIGKIGIGIFSVAQLTHTFQIITKIKGDNYRTVATVALKQYSDENNKNIEADGQIYESGKVNVWREKATDLESHGTTIVLTNIRPQARDTLRSREVWAAIEQSEGTVVVDEYQSLEPPKYHIGRVDAAGDLQKKNNRFSNLPWTKEDSSEAAFKKLVQCVWDEAQFSNPNPQLEKIFDYYLQMVWLISLSIPLSYVDGHLFDMDLSGWAEGFLLSNTPRGAAQHLSLDQGKPIRDQLRLVDGIKKDVFEVYFDDLKLFRPIKFRDLPTTGHAIKTPLVFLGKCREEFNKYSAELSGGALEFEAYLFWTPKIAPTEHRGSLIRINGASGTLFDSSFMRYQVSEQTRLRQITCEIFIHEGFDSSLNIDRESFNYAHPHAVYLTRWLHSALRQLATAQKRVASDIRTRTRDEVKQQQLTGIQQIAEDTWLIETRDELSTPPIIHLSKGNANENAAPEGSLVFDRNKIQVENKYTTNSRTKAQISVVEEKLKAIVQVLASFNLLDKLTKKQQENILKAIYQILEMPE